MNVRRAFLAAGLLACTLFQIDGALALANGAESRSLPVPLPRVIDRASGAEQARKDFAAGTVRLMVAGGIAIYAPEVPGDDPRFAKLPRVTLPSGCTTPHAPEWLTYAGGYNAEVVKQVRAGRVPSKR